MAIKRASYDVHEVAILTDTSVSRVYRTVQRDGEVYGVPVLRKGRNWVMPAAALNRARGFTWQDAHDLLINATQRDAA